MISILYQGIMEEKLPYIISFIIIWIGFLYVFAKYWIKRTKQIWTIEKIPGPPALPVIGNALDMILPSSRMFLLMTGSPFLYKNQTDGELFRFWNGTKPVVLVSKPDAAEKILSSSTILDKGYFYKFLHPWLGFGLLTSTGSKWHSRRKLITPTFHFRILEQFLVTMNEQSDIFVDILRRQKEEEPFNMLPLVARCALDVICESAMGCSVSAQKEESEYVKAVERMSSLIHIRQKSPWLQPNPLFWFSHYYEGQKQDLNLLHGFTRKVIRDRRKQLNEITTRSHGSDSDEIYGKKSRLAFLDLLLTCATENNQKLSDADIQEEVDTFMFEGHDTTAAGINWCLFLLGLHPEVQERCYQELRDVFGDSDRTATMEDLREMKYTENCIKEAQRLYPSVPFIGRELTQNVNISGYNIPSKTTILINISTIHLDPSTWPDPEAFNPDRFTIENSCGRHPYAYVPFSAGPRNCIGQKFAMMEEKVVVSKVLRNFRIVSCDRRDTVPMVGTLILRPEKGTSMKIYKRNKM